MGGGKGGGSGSTVIQFAPYIESAHRDLLNDDGRDALAFSCFRALNEAYNQSPYSGFPVVPVDAGFLDDLHISSYPALFELFDDKIFGPDLGELWNKSYNRATQGTEVEDAIVAQSTALQNEIDSNLLPRLKAGYRDINAVQSSTFVIAQGMLAKTKLDNLADFAAKLRLQRFADAKAMMDTELNWNKTIVTTYSDALKLYYSAKFDADNRTMEFNVKDKLWNLSLFEYGRAMLAALNGATAAKPDMTPSQAAKSISMAASGAGAGAMIGQSISAAGGGNYAGMGAAAGGVVGLAASFM